MADRMGVVLAVNEPVGDVDSVERHRRRAFGNIYDRDLVVLAGEPAPERVSAVLVKILPSGDLPDGVLCS